MDFFMTIKLFFEEVGIPVELIFALIIVIMITESTKAACKTLESKLEDKYKKEIKIFDHTKIIFLIFWSMIAILCLIACKVITWNQFPIYTFALIGSGSFCYELIVKKVKKWLED